MIFRKLVERIASVCAGTDSPRLVVDAMVQVLNQKFASESAPPLVGAHSVSAESDAAKREFLTAMHDFSSAPLFGDVRMLHNDRLSESPSQPETGL